jgi:ribosome biogenesis GTPase
VADALSGLIIQAQGGLFTVHTGSGRYVCRLRGRLKQQRDPTDLAAVGDHVQMTPAPDGTGVIEAILPRTRVLSRRAPATPGRPGRRPGAGGREQVIVANPDQAVFVFAAAQPAPRLGMLDRFLVVAEASSLPALICANKIDLVGPAEAQAAFGLYEHIGYRVLYTSAATGAGIEALRGRLAGLLSVLSGPSGVGKSSLLNAVQPGLGRAARAVSQATTKGRHTTVAPELLPLESGGWVADTPGLRALEPWDIEPEELDGYYVEMRPLVAQCEFADCTHLSEPGCAVRAAVGRGDIAASRYASYAKLRADAVSLRRTE